jgi:hypothetical protein
MTGAVTGDTLHFGYVFSVTTPPLPHVDGPIISMVQTDDLYYPGLYAAFRAKIMDEQNDVLLAAPYSDLSFVPVEAGCPPSLTSCQDSGSLCGGQAAIEDGIATGARQTSQKRNEPIHRITIPRCAPEGPGYAGNRRTHHRDDPVPRRIGGATTRPDGAEIM